MKLAEQFVGVAEGAVARGAVVLTTVGLGSCVAILLHDARATVGGLAHVLLPAPHGPFAEADAPRYATTAVPYLLREMVVRGAARARITARLVGGASLFAAARTRAVAAAGERNLEAVRDALDWAGVPVVGEEVGGDHGRTVRLHTLDGRAVVTAYRHPDVVL